MNCLKFLPCVKKKKTKKIPAFVTIHVIKQGKREDYEVDDLGEDTDEEDAILKALKRINSITKLNDSEFFTFFQ